MCRLVNGSRYYNDLQAKTRLLLDRGVKCMSVLEHTRRSLCEITITCEKKKGRCKNIEFEAYYHDEYEKYGMYCHIFSDILKRTRSYSF